MASHLANVYCCFRGEKKTNKNVSGRQSINHFYSDGFKTWLHNLWHPSMGEMEPMCFPLESGWACDCLDLQSVAEVMLRYFWGQVINDCSSYLILLELCCLYFLFWDVPHKNAGSMLGEAQPHGGSRLGTPLSGFSQVQPLTQHGPGARTWALKLAEDSSS